MIEFSWVWLGLVFPLPFLVRRLATAAKPLQQVALKVPFIDEFSSASKQQVMLKNNWLFILAILAWLLFVVALMRPQWVGEPIEISISGRDLILAVDLSGSMEQRDFRINGKTVNRLEAVKHVANQFIARRTGDRIGLILFGSKAYLQAPLTFDRTTIATLLNEASLRIAGEMTAIGDAIGLAVKRLKEKPAQSKVLILLTDGANTAGEVSPLKAAELASSFNLKVYTIGIGADEMIVRGFFGNQRINPSRELDEKTLTAIAQQTGAKYFRARDTKALAEIYKILDELEPIAKDSEFFYPNTELFHYPLALSLILSIVLSWLRLKNE